MPSKKKKYNARFPAGRIKKIMQTDEEVGKVAQAVPVIISRTLELFVESLLVKSMQITQSRNAKTLTPSHMKQCILSENRFDFLKDLVKNIPDASVQEDNENNAIYEETQLKEEGDGEVRDSPEIQANFYTEQSTSSRTPVIRYAATQEAPKLNFGVSNLLNKQKAAKTQGPSSPAEKPNKYDNIPPLIPISHNFYNQNTNDNLCIDEDYDN